jgi:hypothetical protein
LVDLKSSNHQSVVFVVHPFFFFSFLIYLMGSVDGQLMKCSLSRAAPIWPYYIDEKSIDFGQRIGDKE